MMNQTPPGDSVTLRAVQASDLPIFFEQQLDQQANHMAAFTTKDPTDHAAFMAHWQQILNNALITINTVLAGGEVAGFMVTFEIGDEREVGYWLGKAYWGQGIATQALRQFLKQIETRPLYAHAATDNRASIRVLEKCGFILHGEGSGFSYARNADVAEYIFKLD